MIPCVGQLTSIANPQKPTRGAAMAMGKMKPKEQTLFVSYDDLPRSAGHPFYVKLNELLEEAGFDRWLEKRCAQYYSQEEKRGQPSIPPGVYFRMLLVGYFEGIDSQRGIAWRCSDSLSLRDFLGIALGYQTPDHSTMTNTRKRLPPEVFTEMFQFVLQIAVVKDLVAGKTVGVDSTTLEANAAMKSIMRRDTGEDWKQYVTRLMREEWVSKTDPDSRIAKMKDGRTHLAYKAEHVVDLKSDLVLAAEILPADQGDTQTMMDSVLQAQINLQAANSPQQIEEAAAAKGYHAGKCLELCDAFSVRSYLPERQQPHEARWSDKPPEMKRATYNNRRRVRRAKGRAL